MHRPNFAWEMEEFTVKLLQPRGLGMAPVVRQQWGTPTGGILDMCV